MKTIKTFWKKLFYTKYEIDVCDISGSNESVKNFDIKYVYLKHHPSPGDELNFYIEKNDEWVYAEILHVEYTMEAYERKRSNRYSLSVKLF